jgi:hypothetical protein
MPATLGKVELGLVAPTPEELDAARAILRGATPADKKSRMACMSHFIKGHNDSRAMSSRGSERQTYLEAFTVHQMRQKNAQKKMQTSEAKTTDKGFFTDVFWWSEEKIIKEMGEHKGNAWINFQSPPLKTRKCSITGSESEKLKEYRIPRDWERMSLHDTQSLNITAISDAGEADLKLLREMSSSSDGTAPTDSGATPIKQEPLTPEEKEQKAAKEFKESIGDYIREFQECEVRSGEMKSQLQTSKYAGAILNDVEAHSTKVTKLLRVLQRLQVQTSLLDPNKAKQVIQHMEHVRKEQRELAEHAVKFGLTPKPARKRKT